MLTDGTRSVPATARNEFRATSGFVTLPAMNAWTQVYDPLGWPLFSTALAAVPVVLLLGLLATGRVSAAKAAMAGLAAALVIAIFCYVPSGDAGYGARLASWTPTMLAAAANGAAFGLFPIGWIVLAAIFLYTLTVETGQFEIVKHSVVVAVRRPADPGAADRVLLRGVRRRGGGIRHAGGHLGGADDGRRLPAAARRRPGADRQHLAGRLRRAGHADHHAGQTSPACDEMQAQRRWPAGSCRSSR